MTRDIKGRARLILILAACFLCVLITSKLKADSAPVFWIDANQVTRGYMDASGNFMCRSLKQQNTGQNIQVKNSAGTSLLAFSTLGALTLNVTDNCGSMAIGQLSATQEVTLTFNTAETDTNYRILATLEDTATTTATWWVKRRNTTSFVVGTVNVNDATTTLAYAKVRTAE